MAVKRTNQRIALPPRYAALIRKKVESGQYDSPDEVVREGLRLLEARDEEVERLREEVEIGWQESERGGALDGPAVFTEIRMLSKARRARAKNGE